MKQIADLSDSIVVMSGKIEHMKSIPWMWSRQ